MQKTTNEVSRVWFAIFNDPEGHGYEGTPQEICERLKAEWCSKETRTGSWAYCIRHYEGCYPIFDEDGDVIRYVRAVTPEEKARVPSDLRHVHMVLENAGAVRFSYVKNVYAGGRYFNGIKGNKREAKSYVLKTGIYSEKLKREARLPWEEIIYIASKEKPLIE